MSILSSLLIGWRERVVAQEVRPFLKQTVVVLSERLIFGYLSISQRHNQHVRRFW